MDTSQLECCINCDPLLRQHVLGVFAADQLSQVVVSTYPCGFIVNTDVQSQRGKHWCAFYVNESGETEFFDSYGYPPKEYSHFFLHCGWKKILNIKLLIQFRYRVNTRLLTVLFILFKTTFVRNNHERFCE